MGKAVKVFGVLSVMALLITQSVSAQMINYKRLRGETSAPVGSAASAEESGAPQWIRNAPRAVTSTERRYDFNRDGRLQAGEAISFLRLVIQEVERRGGYEIDSDFLREYDRNRDGYINRYEVEAVKRDIR